MDACQTPKIILIDALWIELCIVRVPTNALLRLVVFSWCMTTSFGSTTGSHSSLANFAKASQIDVISDGQSDNILSTLFSRSLLRLSLLQLLRLLASESDVFIAITWETDSSSDQTQ
ncbi:unnamed protein product [Periconia digitata]|uniref:Uncharacterized protein n=1 Tax=Periconia digitata TaxID=1303443 RepID=A0A9W4XKF2_9PLEO|nr:unnamed protein product [Periconia digitata]